MQKWVISMTLIAVPIYCLMYASGAEASGISAVELNLIPTAETVGKGGYSLSVGAFSYDLKKRTTEAVEVDAGRFLEEKLPD